MDANGRIVMIASRQGNLYYLQEFEVVNALTNTENVNLRCWHERLGHLKGRDVAKLLKKLGKDVKKDDIRLLRDCEILYQR